MLLWEKLDLQKGLGKRVEKALSFSRFKRKGKTGTVCRPVIPVTWEAEPGGLQVGGQPEQFSETRLKNNQLTKQTNRKTNSGNTKKEKYIIWYFKTLPTIISQTKLFLFPECARLSLLLPHLVCVAPFTSSKFRDLVLTSHVLCRCLAFCIG